MDDQALVDIGRELAEMEVNRLVKASKTNSQMQEGLFTLAVMAQNILATVAYNYIHIDGMTDHEALNLILDDIEQELDFIEGQEMEMVNQEGENND